MAENEQTQEKNQEPTQRRLEKAREDGNVLSSKEMFVGSGIRGLIVREEIRKSSNLITILRKYLIVILSRYTKF